MSEATAKTRPKLKVNQQDIVPAEPLRPELDDCCASGCTPCIFERYEDDMERYRIRLQQWEDKNAGNPLNK
ncbi:oxidoreductase-like domain-containing protein [Glaciimonas immobilis]|uniref:Oxidoreductase-like domain-containing protein n=1 Tax=Glaciimonas immobilis TaxID=728004 RepID=A0A840S1N7_9BURK|nr:oxidoreductase-like domain-containing protein [Glaciimonas immobilis]KAF3996008.1 oxidoreductase [Glaciimonas immobilis]MBB5202479.1 hypothetical protein [Glaciimonas immobilis]